MAKNILFKISGDLVENQEVLDIIIKEKKDSSKAIGLIYGCGTQISNALKEKNISFEYERGIRKTTYEGLKIALEISNKIRNGLEEQLGKDIIIYSPLAIEVNEIINTNSEDIFRIIHHDYDKKYICTKEGRDKSELSKLPNTEVLYFK